MKYELSKIRIGIIFTLLIVTGAAIYPLVSNSSIKSVSDFFMNNISVQSYNYRNENKELYKNFEGLLINTKIYSNISELFESIYGAKVRMYGL